MSRVGDPILVIANVAARPFQQTVDRACKSIDLVSIAVALNDPILREKNPIGLFSEALQGGKQPSCDQPGQGWHKKDQSADEWQNPTIDLLHRDGQQICRAPDLENHCLGIAADSADALWGI